MGTSFLTPGVPDPRRSLFLATPAYEAVKPGFAYSLALTTAELVRHHVPFEIGIMEGNCHVDDGRNTLVREFLNGNCTDMLFLDSDVMWSAKDVLKLLAHSDELVCGAYPKKCTPTRYPIGRILHTRANGLLEVSYAPTGFMRIRREAFEKLMPTQSRHGTEKPTAVFFERRFNGNTRDGGDVTFCRKWIAAGGKVVVDPTFTLSHIGETRWVGNFIGYLANDENRARHFSDEIDRLDADVRTFVSEGGEMWAPADPDTPIDLERVAQCMKAIVDGDESLDAFTRLAKTNGNIPWAAPAGLLHIAWLMAKNLPEDATILETGTGISTVVLAASGRKLVSLENDGRWAEKTQSLLDACGVDSTIVVARMNGKWYDAKERVRGLNAQMVLIDGPARFGHDAEQGPHDLGRDRMWPVGKEARGTGVVAPGAALIVDDVRNITGLADCIQGGTERRPWCVGRLKDDNVPVVEKDEPDVEARPDAG